MLVGFYNYTVILTYLSLLSSVVGLGFALHGRPFSAVICLLAAGLCDTFDGTIARTRKKSTEQEKSFGIQIDSLCDFVAFGVMPCCIAYATGYAASFAYIDNPSLSFLDSLPMCVVYAFYILAALIRLAYFNVLESEKLIKQTGGDKVYYGLPVTSIALIMPIVYSISYIFFRKGYHFPMSFAVMAMFLIVGFAFVIGFKIRKPKMKTVLVLVGIGFIEFVFIVLLAFDIIKL